MYLYSLLLTVDKKDDPTIKADRLHVWTVSGIENAGYPRAYLRGFVSGSVRDGRS